MQAPDLRVELLGGFRVWVGARSVEEYDWRLRKAKNLVKLLALASQHCLHCEEATASLWPEAGARASKASLRQALHSARRALAPEPKSTNRYLQVKAERILLSPAVSLVVDVDLFERAAAAARGAQDPAPLRRALRLYTGDLLPEDRYEDWAHKRREELRSGYLALLVDLAWLYEERGELNLAVDALQRVLRSEPEHEEAHTGLMRLYALTGQRVRALQQFGRLEQSLRDLGAEFEAEPTANTRRLYEAILSGNPAGKITRASRPVPPREVSKRHNHNLPVSLTSFVGREREIAEIERLLATTRLLTLTGIGGSGKSRLALEVAAGLIADYPDGVWLVELATISDPALVPQAIAKAVGVREQPDRPLTATLLSVLKSKRLLFVLDNCEHLVSASAQLAETLLAGCFGLRLLTTSREPLNIAAEATWAVPSLSLPDATQLPSPADLGKYEAVQLFVERASRRQPAFTLTPQNAPAVAEICRRLEGIPLALELAAARVRALSAQQIAARLDDSLGLLAGGNRTAAPRQQTLQGALDWSYRLLGEGERRLLERLSVFAGGWTLEAAEAVTLETSRQDVLEGLSQLVDKSLVIAETEGPAAASGVLRYRLLEPVRQYARHRLQGSGEEERVQRRHALWYLALAERAELKLTGPEQLAWLERLELEHDNLRAVLAWALEHEDAEGDRVELALRLAGALWRFWYSHGHCWSEGRGWLERSLSVKSPVAAAVRAKALHGGGWTTLFQGDYELAKTLLAESLTLFRDLGDEGGIASVLTNLGFVAVFQGDHNSIRPLLEEATALKPALTNQHTLAYLIMVTGLASLIEGNFKRAVTLHEESLALFRKLGDRQGMIWCLTNLGLIVLGSGQRERAEALLRENLELSQQSRDILSIQYSLLGLAGVATHEEPRRAARLWGAAECLREVSGLPLHPLVRTYTDYDGYLAKAQAQLSEAAFATAWAEGRAMTLEQAILYALSPERVAPETVLEVTLPVMEPRPGSKPFVSPLSRREQEIAELIAQGFSSRQIAAELAIAGRTVDNHIARILSKLKLKSRAQVAVWITKRRL